MAVIKEEKKEKPRSKAVITFNNYLDDYFGLIILATVMAILVLSVMFLLLPRFYEAKEVIAGARDFLDEQELQINTYSKKIDEYMTDYGEISDDNKVKVNDMIAPKIRYSSIYHTDLIIMLNNLLEENEYLISDLSVSQSEKREAATRNKKIISKASQDEVSQLPPGVFAVNVSVSLEEVNYQELKELLDLLENRQRLIDVINVDFDPESSTATLGLTTYSFRHEDDIEK